MFLNVIETKLFVFRHRHKQCLFTAKNLFRSFPSARQNSNRVKPVSLAYSSYGAEQTSSVPPVVVMHGVLGSKRNWNSIAKMINKKTNRKVFVLDARNHGDSPHSPDMTYNHMVEDLREFIEQLHMKSVAMIGHSMGGRAMMMFALTYPEVVEKLVVVDISPIGSTPNYQGMIEYLRAMKKIQFERNIGLQAARKLADEELTSVVKNKTVRQFLLTNLVEAETGVKWQVNLEAILNNFEEISYFPVTNKTYDGPTYFIGGEDSSYIRKEDEPAIRKIFPRTKLDYIPGADHWVHSEKPTEFLDLTCKFLMGEHQI